MMTSNISLALLLFLVGIFQNAHAYAPNCYDSTLWGFIQGQPGFYPSFYKDLSCGQQAIVSNTLGNTQANGNIIGSAGQSVCGSRYKSPVGVIGACSTDDGCMQTCQCLCSVASACMVASVNKFTTSNVDPTTGCNTTTNTYICTTFSGASDTDPLGTQVSYSSNQYFANCALNTPPPPSDGAAICATSGFNWSTDTYNDVVSQAANNTCPGARRKLQLVGNIYPGGIDMEEIQALILEKIAEQTLSWRELLESAVEINEQCHLSTDNQFMKIMQRANSIVNSCLYPDTKPGNGYKKNGK